MAATGASVRGRALALAKYEVIEEIGHGGMATVYRARDPRLGRDVAIKVIHPHLRDSLEAKHRFYVEAQAVAKLRHPNIVEVFDVSGEGELEQYLVVELVRGATLRKLLHPRGSLPPEVAAALGVELLAALAHAHEAGVVHRDVKPENVMIEHRPVAPPPVSPPLSGSTSSEPAPRTAAPLSLPGERVSVKLTDFGIAKLLDAQGVTSTGQVLGSPAHMAPEQIEGGDVDPRADVFGLGVLLYEGMVGHLPFEGNNPAQVLRRVLEGIYPAAERESPKVGSRWSAILDRALARAPSARFEGAAAMQGELVAELKLLGIDNPRAELEAWFDDRDAYEAAREPALVAKLSALGLEARKRGAPLEAAAHFNRALAYAPNDPTLLRIVSSMHRERAWKTLALRLLSLILVSLTLGTGAFFLTRVVRDRVTRRDPRPGASALTSPAPLPTGGPAEPLGAVPNSATASPSSRRPAVPVVRPPARNVERKITLESVRPPFGVLVAIDGAPNGEAHDGSTFVLDGRAHELRFTCVKDQCAPQARPIAPGEEPEAMAIVMAIKAATVFIDGDPALQYGIEEFPSIAVRVGVPTAVPVPHGNYAVHVVERPSGRRETLSLDPGREARLAFGPPPADAAGAAGAADGK
ncbi:MAG TPA: serine/threonine-protein kinase [Polyangiaceae bacterium]|jgi:serine/threonine-protein kinase